MNDTELEPKKFCDPGICDCCQYIGEGDFLCDKHMEIVNAAQLVPELAEAG